MRKILPFILASLTNHPRELVTHAIDFEWSNNLWIHNIFRVYEMLFGRRAGIRPSVASSPRGQIAFDFEALCALGETYVRALIKRLSPKIVIIPQLQLALINQQVGFMPYRFAIAFDTATAKGSPPMTSALTFSHTCTGSNLTFCMGGGMNAASTTSPTATYNSVSLTVFTLQNTTSWGFVGYLPSPATGANTASANDSVATEWAVNSLSLTGTATTPSAPGSTTAKATSTAPSFGVTTTVANSFVVTSCWSTNGTFGTTTTGTNQTSRSTSQDLDSNFSAAISTQTTTTTGSYTSGWTIANALWIGGAVEIQPGTGTVTVIPLRTLLGVGI